MSSWKAPISPFGLVQEPYFDDEWKVLVCCQLLNMTTHVQVRKVLHELFMKYPCPASMASAKEAELKVMLMPLGFYNKRAKALVRFSQEYLAKKWKTAKDLYGIGKYGDDAWHIFCVGDWKNVKPNDQALNKYHDWLWERENA
jgi:methyl-CpG-binding domain protein 4